MIRFYKVTIQSAHFCRHCSFVYREQRPAGLQQRRNGGCLLIVVFFWSPLCSFCLFLFFSVRVTALSAIFKSAINSIKLSMRIPGHAGPVVVFPLPSIYEILRDNQLINQPFRGFTKVVIITYLGQRQNSA